VDQRGQDSAGGGSRGDKEPTRASPLQLIHHHTVNKCLGLQNVSNSVSDAPKDVVTTKKMPCSSGSLSLEQLYQNLFNETEAGFGWIGEDVLGLFPWRIGDG